MSKRLDRGFGNKVFGNLFGPHTSYHLIAYSSDHHPILISVDKPTGDFRWRRVVVFSLTNYGLPMKTIIR